MSSKKHNSSDSNLSRVDQLILQATKAFLHCIGLIPINLRSHLGSLLGSLAYYLPIREKRVALRQIAWVLPSQNPDKVCKAMFANLGKNFFESLNLNPLLRASENRVELENPELFKVALNSTRPVIGLTAHTGNWDLLAAYFVKRGLKLSTIGRPARNPLAQSMLSLLRDKYGVKVLWRHGKSGIREIMQELNSGSTVSALIDQDTRVSSVYRPFFGKTAKSPSALIAMAKKNNARIYACFNSRQGLNNFRIHLYELDENQSIENIIDQYHHYLEKVILQNPAQWVWVHKRWRSPSENQTMSTKEYLNFIDTQLVELNA